MPTTGSICHSFLQRIRLTPSQGLGLIKTSVSESPRHDHVDPKRRNIREQLNKLKVDVCQQFPALLQPLAQIVSCDAIQYSISIIRKIREHFPHVKLYKVLLAVERQST
ncbi:uncharacterized protein [Pyrus communis]|uniref:uncharacterized protein isoform X1 n=1 Tax=Pyrus communis TaxID=23211 RepID=UPI0035C0B8C6